MQPVIFCHFDALQSDKLHTKDSIPSRFISLSLSPLLPYTFYMSILLKEIWQAGYRGISSHLRAFIFIRVLYSK